jgi:hypothetical protein
MKLFSEYLVEANYETEAEQLAAVKEHGMNLKHIVQSGIVPSEAVQLAAVKHASGAIKFIKDPSEAVQVAAINKFWSAIDDIENPCEAAQLAAVTRYGYSIENIIDKGIIPSDKVQVAAVKQNSGALQILQHTGIKISPRLHFIEVYNVPSIENYFINPTRENLNIVLTDQKFIMEWKKIYDKFVKHIFANNSVMVNKWLRYSENMRNM